LTKQELLDLGVKVDPEDEHYLDEYTWRLASPNKRESYVITTIRVEGKRKPLQLHRLVLGVGSYSENKIEVDHMNGDLLDNRKENLREVSHAENKQNLPHLDPRSTSGYRGVYFRKDKKKWEAYCRINGKRYHVGYYSTPAEAGEAAKAFRLKHMPGALS